MVPDSHDSSPIPALAAGATLERLYGGAVLHLAWIVSQGARRLVFGYLECLPCEIPRPVDDGEYTTRLPGRIHRVYGRHLPLDIRPALAWYEAAIRGVVVRPDEDGSLPDVAGRGMLGTAPLHEDVVWPRTLCVHRNAVPFLSLWHRTPRVHHLLPVEPWLVGDLDDRERRAVTDFVNEHFGFSLEEWSALWGSIHIVLPDPYHRAIFETFEVDAAGEVLVVRVEPRQGLREVRPPMTLTVMEQRQSGVAGIVTRSLPSEGDVRIRLSPRLAAKAISVADDDGTVYVARPPTHFLQSMDVEGQVQHTRRQVSLARRGKAPPTEYEVGVASTMIRSRVGDASPDTPRAETVLARMSDRRKVARMGRRLEQRWFYRERVAAEEHIRALIGHASERLVFVDSYFTHHELLRYALAAKTRRVPIDVLTSPLAFGEREGQVDPADFVSQLEQVKADADLGVVSVRVMGASALHDRFLLVDEKMYSLGGSLSEMGHRGMMVIRVPDPTPIRADLAKIWRDAPWLDEWIVERLKVSPIQVSAGDAEATDAPR